MNIDLLDNNITTADLCHDNDNTNNVSLFPDNQTTKRKTQLSFISFNVCGLQSKLMITAFVEYVSKFDIVFFTKTKTDEVDSVSTLIPGKGNVAYLIILYGLAYRLSLLV